MTTITINRAPVLTLWAAVVAERLGYDRDEAVTLGRAVAGLNAATKAQALGLAKPGGKAKFEKSAKPAAHGGRDEVPLCNRLVPIVHTPDGVRATSDGRPTDPFPFWIADTIASTPLRITFNFSMVPWLDFSTS